MIQKDFRSPHPPEGVKKFNCPAKSAFHVVQGTEKFVRLRRTKIGGTGMIPNGYPPFREGTPATWNKTM